MQQRVISCNCNCLGRHLLAVNAYDLVHCVDMMVLLLLFK